ncbi:MAG: 23S rRNA (guanosine(2251)-2'-O)-methyltransferase RlmB [Firmicutes bacterium]|nr:23S rRNA (guanosine(2251)-2'-O)-methyltransferase RlmB [Bacillota bacterium]MCL5040677.1 23S rRNA (guanosine(2251)-2'-O)-methyltransferase RlmB [Bacillota bacterium]
MDNDQIEGKNVVLEALRAGRPINRILLAEGMRQLQEIRGLARQLGIPVELVKRERLDRESVTGRHQGVIAQAAAKGYAELEDLLSLAAQRGQAPLLLVLDGIEDPHNLGALLRTVETAGAHGVVIPKHHAVGLTAAVARASAGAMEYVSVARVTNLVRAIGELQEAGLWVYGADANGEKIYWETDLRRPLALVVGGEDRGISRLVKEKCDLLVRIPMQGSISSLNASVAGALLLYEARRQRWPTPGPTGPD